jgi:hypothetical protein
MNVPIENQPHSPELPSVTPSAEATKKGSLALLIGVIFQPQAAFRSLGKKPNWLLPLVACLILVLLSTVLIINRMGVSNLMRSAMQGNPQAEEMAQKVEESSFAKTMIYVSPLIQTPVVLVVVAGVFLLVFMLAGVETNFKTTFSVAAYSFFAYSVVATLLSLVTVYAAKDFANLDLRNLIATNVGFFLDPAETSKFLYNVTSSLDVLSFWLIYLLALGFAETSPKTRIQKTLPLVIMVWAIYVLGKAAFSGMFGR